MASEAPLWDIYYTYIDASVPFHYFFDDPGRPHLYPAVRALSEQLDPARRGGRALRQPGRPAARSARGVGRFLEGLRPGRDGPRPRGQAKRDRAGASSV
ncbi:MAG: hypothetical protein MZU91_11480 [Desulfosudis oleivorans]|nr:hypothetical protein [Desulfosudis oleivorans]